MEALDTLAAEADALGTTAPATPGQPPAQAAPTETPEEGNTRALCVVLAMLREASASPVLMRRPLRTLAARLPDEALPAIAGPWGRVLAHYGVNAGGLMDDHPLTAALFATGPLLWTIAQELRAELAERRAERAGPPVAVAERVDTASGD